MIAIGSISSIVLVLTRHPSDASVLVDVLRGEGMQAIACESLDSLCQRITAEAGVAVVAEEVISCGAPLQALRETLEVQPVWSDFPLIIMTTAGETNVLAVEIASGLEGVAQATFLERPVRLSTLLSAVRAALQARERQYEVRDHLVALDQAMAQKNLLLAELSHRVKNMLALIQSIASQTVRRSESLIQFRSEFDGRLQSLSVSHSILTRSNWEGGELRTLVMRILEPFVSGGSRRLTISGEDISLTPRATQALCMFLHELASNAAKYGALSVPSGIVSISWSVDQADRCLTIEWVERGGPAVQQPARNGFGTSLIERLVPYELAGSTILAFEPGGVTCWLTIPLADNVIRAPSAAIT